MLPRLQALPLVHAMARGIAQLGVFGIEDEAGSALYRDAGLRAVGRQVEWSRQLEEQP